jgi:nitrogen fixation protein NifB
VARGLIKPFDAAERVDEALRLCPAITVVGIAGPGDPLASGEAIAAFERVREVHPEIMLCLSTNGLMLPDYAARLIEIGVSSITVTVNAVDPDILHKIVSRVAFRGVTYKGTDGAKILIERQLEGIRAVSKSAMVKINTVLIPGVNDGHIALTAKTVADAGARMYNIIPLIPQHEFASFPPPGCADVERARAEAGRYIDVFRHCKHCRADACGIPGVSEFASELSAAPETFSHG